MCEKLAWLTLFALIASAVAALPARAQDPSLFGWWTLDDGSGTTAVDSSGRGNDGTINNPEGGLGIGNDVWCYDDERGVVASFSGDDTNGTYISTLVKIPFLDLQSDFTWAFWAKQHPDQPTITPGSGNDVMLGNRYGGTDPPLQFVKFTAAKFEFYNDDANYLMSIDYEDMPGGQWVYCVGVKKGATLSYYRNGIPMGTATLTKTMDANPFFMGGDPQGERWRGWLSDVRLYERALSLEEVQQLCPPSRIAQDPDPPDGAPAVSLPLLQWKPGYQAYFHELYVGTSPDLGPANLVGVRSTALLGFYTGTLEPGRVYYWRVNEIEVDGVTVHPGDVWSFTAQALTAYLPTPADGATDASLAPMLLWQPGQMASTHHVYFSEDANAVSQGSAEADKGEVPDPNFAPGPLEPATNYAWRVDETTLLAGVKTGPVWHFVTCLPVDDFESYNDEEGQNTRIYETWLDGYSDGSSGSIVGNTDAPFAEQTIIHGGLQSMPMDYNNVNSPFYSEALREFDPAQDWTINDVNTLVLYVRGQFNNVPAPLYLTLEDAARHTTTVVHPDPEISTRSQWATWRIPLSEFTGVDATRVKKLYLGVGDKANPRKGGAGRIYIDDIRVIKAVE